jgi:hypothetical protein
MRWKRLRLPQIGENVLEKVEPVFRLARVVISGDIQPKHRKRVCVVGADFF